MTNGKPKVVVITGATASGKSSLAVEMALYFDAEIVNADSMQVYRGMDVGTSKPSMLERKDVPHHLLDVVDPDEEFNASIYRSLAIPLLNDCAPRDKIPFVVGGTGLYIKSLLGGLIKCPPIDLELREALHKELMELGPAHLHERLKRLDPESALRIHQNDRVRIIRALEIIYLTQQSLSSLIRRHRFKNRPFQTLKICLQLGREHLYHRINRRSLAMIEAGLVNETEDLLNKGYSPDLKPMKSLGYRHMVAYLSGACDLGEAIRQLQSDTRRYAKRQLTWFRADPEMVWMRPEELNNIIKKIEQFTVDTP